MKSTAPLLLARVLTTNTSIPVSAIATAEINANAPSCIIALGNSSSSTNGISLSGTGSITADDCQVESNSSICADSGANSSDVITTKYLSYDSGANPTSSKCKISPPAGTASANVSKASASDPLAGNSEVSGATNRISTVAAIKSPSAPTVPTSTTTMSFPTTGLTSGLPTAWTAAYNSSTKAYTVTCTGTATFGTFSLGKNVSVTISTSAGNTYQFQPGLADQRRDSGRLRRDLWFRSGHLDQRHDNIPGRHYNILGGITTGGGSTTTFAVGTYNIGSTSCDSYYGVQHLQSRIEPDFRRAEYLRAGRRHLQSRRRIFVHGKR